MIIRGILKFLLSPQKLDKTKGKQMACFHFQPDGKTSYLLCSGFILPYDLGDYIELEGEMKGSEFQVTDCRSVDDSQVGATTMLKFLFGKKTSVKLISHFGEDAVKAIATFKNSAQHFRNECDKIKGISDKTVDKAYLKYSNNLTAEFIYNEFQKFGMDLDLALRVFKNYGERAMKSIEKNPYYLLNISGVDFKLADNIALKYYAWSNLDKRRIIAGVQHVMNLAEKEGHTYMRLEKPIHHREKALITESMRLLKTERPVISECLIDLERERKIVIDNDGKQNVVYRTAMYEYETAISYYIKNLTAITRFRIEDIESCINNFEQANGFRMAEKQKQAVITSLRNRCSIITGPPGSGKTTVIDAICESLTQLAGITRDDIKLAAPTGKAANRITESTGMHAETIHRLLRYSPVDGEFVYNEKNKLPLKVLIIDEVSMLGVKMFYYLLKAIPERAFLIIVGDYDQLASVDSGKVLEDLIQSQCIPTTMLNEIYRQKAGSTLAQKTLDIANNKVPSVSRSSDFEFYEMIDTNEALNKVMNLYLNNKNKYGLDKIAILTPMNKTALGVTQLNDLIQARINPLGDRDRQMLSGKRVFRVGDRVIQMTNEESFQVYNGMVGTITEINLKDDEDEENIVVDYGNIEVKYTRDRFENIQLAYALTIHKTQGSGATSSRMKSTCTSVQKF